MLGLTQRIKITQVHCGHPSLLRAPAQAPSKVIRCAANTSGAVTQSEQPPTGSHHKLSAMLGAHTQGCPQGNHSSPTLEERCLAAPRRHRKGHARESDHRSRTARGRYDTHNSQKTSAGTTPRAQAARSVHTPQRLPGRRPTRVQEEETHPDRPTAITMRSTRRVRNFLRPHALHACTCGLGNARNYLYKWTNWTVKHRNRPAAPSPTHGPKLGRTGLTD